MTFVTRRPINVVAPRDVSKRGSTNGDKGIGVTVKNSTRRVTAAVALGLAAVITLGACSSEPTVSASGTSGGGPKIGRAHV